jgi:4-amino-4-deoxy-L-arabinose transferase-like glycosyltransferase
LQIIPAEFDPALIASVSSMPPTADQVTSFPPLDVLHRPRAIVVAYALAAVLAMALMSSPSFRGHIDDLDSQIYTVVARHMVEDHTWMDLRDFIERGPQWRQHLPFGFWPYAWAIRLWGESALSPLAAIFSLGTVCIVGWAAHRIAGPSAGVIGMLVMSNHRLFYLTGARPRLDPVLLLLVTASAVPLLFPRIERRHWTMALCFCSMAVLVKGPFGLLPLAGLIAARSIVDQSRRVLGIGSMVILLSLIPVATFLLWNKFFGDESWWNSYLINQVLASATGARSDGTDMPWYPLTLVVQRSWPGLWLIMIGLWICWRPAARLDAFNRCRAVTARQAALTLCVACLFILIELVLPARKHFHHGLVLIPWLALFAAVTTGPLLDSWLSSSRAWWLATFTFAVPVFIVSIAVLLGHGPRWYNKQPCVTSLEFSQSLKGLHEGEDIWVVSTTPAWALMASIAAETRLVPWRARTLPLKSPAADFPVNAHVALMETTVLSPELGPWEKVNQARGWILLRMP